MSDFETKSEYQNIRIEINNVICIRSKKRTFRKRV